MTLFKPQISLRRLTIKRGHEDIYDATFHSGVNILRGENSSGKSTIMDFIFYALGGDLTDWREAALLCSEVIAEVTLNGHSAVLAREVSASAGRPMRISFSDFNVEGAEPTWAIYPYKRSQNRESFSQVLFRLLGMPEAAGDANSNITMHQVLRVLYADQLSPVDRIFRFERFDTALTRQTVGDLLCGAYDNTLYRQQLRLRDAEKEFANATAEWRSAVAVFAGIEHAINLEWVNAERAILEKNLADTHAEAEALEQKIFHAEVSDGLTLKEQEAAYAALIEAQQALLKAQSDRDALQLEIVDSDNYIAALEAKLDQLRDAESAAAMLKGISFIYCPSCYAPIEDDQSSHACSLCKSPFDQSRAQGRILALINETALQLKQSQSLQSVRKSELDDLEARISTSTRTWNSLSERYKLLNRLPSTELRSRARELYGRAGYLERQIEDLGQKAILIERIEALSMVRQKLNSEILVLKESIEASERRQKERLRKSYTAISDNTVMFLRNDLQRQDTFQKAESIPFNFGDDRLSVNGESFFSASSMVYLRNSFFAAFLKAAIEDPEFRHPRFLLLDTMEDKGMEPERSHHFQKQLVNMSESTDVEHQLIFATSMISPQLESSNLVVDRFYTHDNRTLNLA